MKNKTLIENILTTQNVVGIDQRKPEQQNTYTKENLEQLPTNELLSIIRKINHPIGRPW